MIGKIATVSEAETALISSPEFQREAQHAHKRVERWMRLQQFVYGLSGDYSYAVCSQELPGGEVESRVLISLGWLTWFGRARGRDNQQSLTLALLETSEAWSSDGTKTFFHGFRRWFFSWFPIFRSVPVERKFDSRDSREADQLAG